MIKFTAVSKRYKEGAFAVRDFTHTISAGHITVLVGSSGSGKTTLLRMINRMVEPTSGTIHVRGTDVSELDPVELRRSIGYVMQMGGLLPHRTVIDNVVTVPVLSGVSKREARLQAPELMARVGLDPDLGHRYPSQLSGGQQQRVSVARALATDPDILLMDEPFGAVDPIVRSALQEELLRLQAEIAKTIVLVTHDIDEAFRLGDEIVILKQGGIVAQIGTPQSILASPADDFVSEFVGADHARRQLSIVPINGQSIAMDGSGRTVGVLEA